MRQQLDQPHMAQLLHRKPARQALGAHLLAADPLEAHLAAGGAPERRHQTGAQHIAGGLAGHQDDPGIQDAHIPSMPMTNISAASATVAIIGASMTSTPPASMAIPR